MFGIEFLREDAPIERLESESEVAALALAMAILQAKKLGADRIRLSNAEGIIIDDFPV